MIRSSQISFHSTSNPFCLKNTLSQVLQFLQSSTNQSPIHLIFIWLELSKATTYDSTEFICLRTETLRLPVSGLMCPFILRGLVLISNDVKFFTQNLLGQDLPLLEGKTWPHLKRGDKSKPLKQQGKPTDYSGWECGGSFQGHILSASLLVGPVVTSLFISQPSSLKPQCFGSFTSFLWWWRMKNMFLLTLLVRASDITISFQLDEGRPQNCWLVQTLSKAAKWNWFKNGSNHICHNRNWSSMYSIQSRVLSHTKYRLEETSSDYTTFE